MGAPGPRNVLRQAGRARAGWIFVTRAAAPEGPAPCKLPAQRPGSGEARSCGPSPGAALRATTPTGGEATTSVYIHAPFCARRCSYCDFAVTVDRSGGHEIWLAAVSAEWRKVRREGLFSFPDPLETLYVGGGTPSLLGPSAMAGLASLLGRRLLDPSRLEWTAEANPESFTRETAYAWRRAGVNRVSLGVQSFHGPSLRWMGRLHGSEGAAGAVRTARRAGFSNLSVDLIFGLPRRLGRDWSEDLRRALDLGVEHMSLYGLTVEPRTPLGKAVALGRERVASGKQYRDEYLEAVERLTGAGYLHYEVSSFARPGRASRHNEVYWSGRPYLGLGNGAHSYLRPVRRWNLSDWGEYRKTVASGSSAIGGSEVLGRNALRLERLWLELRSRGVVLAELPPEGAALVQEWRRRGLAARCRERVGLTAEGWLLLDTLVVGLDEAIKESDYGVVGGTQRAHRHPRGVDGA